MIILREVVLNSDRTFYKSKSIGNYSDFANIINMVKKVCNDIAKVHLQNNNNIRLTLHRIPHQQFHWQSSISTNIMMRYHKIYTNKYLENHVIGKLGISHTELLTMSLQLTAHFRINSNLNLETLEKACPYNSENVRKFLNKITIDIDLLKTKLIENQKFDDSWEYTANPFEQYPLVTLKKNTFTNVSCPFPQLLQKRISEGLYFDVVDDTPIFSDSFGKSFQDYVGDVLKKIFSNENFEVIPETDFMNGKKISHGVDWILTDDTASLFVECKTKRLRLKSKFDLESEEFVKDIDKLSEAISQTYKNVTLAINGKSNWEYNKKPIYPILITLEDWLIISPTIRENLNDLVREKLIKAGLNPKLMVTMPFTISSINSFEIASSTIRENGINSFMSVKVNDEFNNWDISNFSREFFKDNYYYENEIFPEDLEKFMRDAYGLLSKN
jgi:hypothetical protein